MNFDFFFYENTQLMSIRLRAHKIQNYLKNLEMTSTTRMEIMTNFFSQKILEYQKEIIIFLIVAIGKEKKREKCHYRWMSLGIIIVR